MSTRVQQYFDQTAKVPPSKMDRAKGLFRTFLGDFKRFCSTSQASSYIGDPVLSGSVSEGLKVKAADEFDLLLPLKLSTTVEPRLAKSSQVPSIYYYLHKQGPTVSSGAYSSRTFDPNTCFDEMLRLNHANLKRAFQSFMQRFLNEVQKGSRTYTARLVTNRPGVTIQLESSSQPGKIDVDIIPTVYAAAGGASYVAKSPKSVPSDTMWRQTYSTDEATLLRSCSDENLKKALMVAKSVQKDNAQLQAVPSYFLKTIAMHLIKESPGRKPVDERLAEILGRLRDAAKARMLRHAFRHDTNLLQECSASRLDNLGSYLDRVLIRGVETIL